MDDGRPQQLARVLPHAVRRIGGDQGARERIDQAIAKQDDIKKEIKLQEDKNEPEKKPIEGSQRADVPDLEKLPKAVPAKVQQEKAIQDAGERREEHKIAEKQAKNAFTRRTRRTCSSRSRPTP